MSIKQRQTKQQTTNRTQHPTNNTQRTTTRNILQQA